MNLNKKKVLEYELKNLNIEYLKARCKAYREADQKYPFNWTPMFGTRESIDSNNERDHEIECYIRDKTKKYRLQIEKLREKLASITGGNNVIVSK